MEWGGGHGELVPFKVVAPGRSDRLQSMVTHPRKRATLIVLYGCLKNNDEELGEYRVGRVDLAGAGGRERLCSNYNVRDSPETDKNKHFKKREKMFLIV